MKVLLLSPPYLPGYMRNARCDFVSLSGSQWYPILLGYCGAWLEAQGHETRLIDAPTYGLDHDETQRRVAEFAPDWMVLYTGRLSEENDIAFARDAVAALPNMQVVIVGPYASVNPLATLEAAETGAGIRYLVTGEFEHPVAELIGGKATGEIANLLTRENGETRRNAPRPNLNRDQLDAIPFVSRYFRDQLDPRRYKVVSEPYPYLDMLTGRGCAWGHCTYCLWVHTFIKGAVYNTRSVDNVIDELQFIAKEMPEIRSVMLQDDTLTEERCREISEAKIASGNRLRWSCYCRGNISRETLETMKRADCLNLHVGFESANADILRGVKKGVSRDRMTRFAQDAHAAGLRIHGDFAIGFPGETRQSAEETIAWALEIRPHTAQFQLMIPFPGTPFHEEVAAKGWIRDGAPDYPGLSRDELEQLAKQAYRRYYLSWRYLWQALTHPGETLSRLDIYWKSWQSIFLRSYKR